MIEAGTLAEIHADALTLYCEVWARFSADPGAATPSLIAQLRMLQDSLGLSPAAKAQVPVLDPPDEWGKPGDELAPRRVNIAELLAGVRADKSKPEGEST
jgi:hypothetical protein